MQLIALFKKSLVFNL